MGEILEVKNLCKDPILKDISFTVNEGEMVAIMGPSGSGKSTLLYQVSGMDRSDSGNINLNGTAIETLSEDELAKLRLTQLGFVFQQMNMLKNLSIVDNITLPAFHATKSKEAKEKAVQKAHELLSIMGIDNLADRKITEVSGGQLQRACICRSMIMEPEIIFADEPTGALNQTASQEVMEELTRLNSEGTTILIVTHDAKVASKCSRILYLLDGKIKGELSLTGIFTDREKYVNHWLTEMGW